jgi:hypothetical protein
MLAALALFLAACTQDDEVTYTQYNAEDNAVTIDVGADTRYVLADDGVTEVPESVETPLTSNTGSVEIGVATVTPSAGPVGTTHTISVVVYDDYADDIDRVAVRTASGDRGEDEYDLDRDSTGEGYWVMELESEGEADEVRTDTLTFRLYQEVAADTEE